MRLELFAHPFSSYSQKVIIALYEKDIPFSLRLLTKEEPKNLAEFAKRWPIKRFPLLVDGEKQIAEASCIIEYLDEQFESGPRLLPAGPDCLEVRFMDRFFDNYVATPQQRLVYNALRDEALRDPLAEEEASFQLEQSYQWLDRALATRPWAAGAKFSMADCAAAPFLFYANWAHPIPSKLKFLHGYRDRLFSRNAVARVIDEGRPYRHLFPLTGFPDD